VTPEAAEGGPLALVRTGDRIRLSVRDRRIDLLVDEAELARRRVELRSSRHESKTLRGYDKLYAEQVLQADQGCDFGFLLPSDVLLQPDPAR
jgi:dihydroxy-acid dehydratase